ncbi:hypothetical protein ACFLSZ_03455 [Candidatus Bipolaricaulota bacterium]
MIEAKETNDLLTLIGTAIEQLRQSIEWFETSSQAEGVTCLSTVIREIDSYMDRAHDDPLLQLARIDVSSLAADLKHIKSDLVAVIAQVDDPPSA